ncbi:MAG TPA: hypothetical protein VL088_07225 [Pedobacter sp.]|nr:hypothetical protein [Pedobacter sp.]
MYLKSLKVFSILLLLVLSVKAQRSNIVIGPELSLPTGNATNQSPIGYGGYLKGEVGLSEKFSITASGAVTSFLGKKIIGPRQPTISYAPIKAGLKYYTEGNFYFEGQLGASFVIDGHSTTASNNTAFVWSPGIGSFIKSRNSNNQFDIGFRYEGWTSSRTLNTVEKNYTTFSFFSLRAGYAFNL